MEKENSRTETVIAGSEANPYLEVEVRYIEQRFNPDYPYEELCVCGHPYYRHFDTYDEHHAIGCKYCACYVFRPVRKS